MSDLEDINNQITEGTLKMDLLWTNASPTSSFNVQPIKVNTESYKMIIIEIAESTTYLDYNTHLLLTRKGVRFPSLVVESSTYFHRRDFRDKGTQIDVDYGYKGNFSEGIQIDNTCAIPLNVWGVK